MEDQIKKTLHEINFIDRYILLIEKYKNVDKPFQNYDNDKVLKLIQDIGFQATYNAKENFFAIKVKRNKILFQLNISLNYALVELILSIFDNGKICKIGGPFDYVIRLISEVDINGIPSFDSYETLNEIFIEVFKLFEDIIGMNSIESNS